jgi:hypothetical protein
MSKFGMACKDNELLPLIKYVSDQMRFLKNQGISYADMATIKDDLLQSLTFNMKYSGTHNDDYAEHYQELFLKGFPLIALEDKWRLQQQIMADLSLEEVNNFIRLFFDMSKWSCYMDLSEDSEKIDENKVKEILMAQ